MRKRKERKSYANSTDSTFTVGLDGMNIREIGKIVYPDCPKSPTKAQRDLTMFYRRFALRLNKHYGLDLSEKQVNQLASTPSFKQAVFELCKKADEVYDLSSI